MSEAKVEKIKVRGPCMRIHARSRLTETCSSTRKRRIRFSSVCFTSCDTRSSTELGARQGSSFATGVEVQEKRKKVNMISTGSKAVDAILGGMSFVLPLLSAA